MLYEVITNPFPVQEAQNFIINCIILGQTLVFEPFRHIMGIRLCKPLAMFLMDQDKYFTHTAICIKRDTPANRVCPAGTRPALVNPAAAFRYEWATGPAVIDHAQKYLRESLSPLLLHNHEALYKLS